MALVIKRILDGYKYVIVDLADNRTEHFPLVRSPLPTVAIVVVYLMFIFKWGPKFMQHREPYDLKKLLLVYNGLQSSLCFIGVIVASPYVNWRDWYCNPIRPAHIDHHMLVDLGYLYYISKYIDLFDTVFFVLKKNYRQITVLHVTHHTIMVLGCWAGYKYVPSGHSMYIPYINTIVHSIMYGYYFLTVFNPKYKNSIWWKKHITQLQLIQFGLAFIIYGVPLLNGCDTYPRSWLYIVNIFNTYMVTMFSIFYYQTYIKKKSA